MNAGQMGKRVAIRINWLSLMIVFLLAVVFNELSPMASAAPPHYPLKISSNHRYLVDQDNVPFLLQGDSPWSLISAVTKFEAEQYLENRRALGFNTLMVNLVEHHFNGPINREGEGPFTLPGDFSMPNEKYFSHADWVIKKAAEKGIQILLAPCYLGYKGMDEGWYEEILSSGPEKCRSYGQFLGQRYRNFDNIIWLMGGDRDPGKARAQVHEIALGIREFDQRHLFSAHCEPEQAPVDGYALETWLDINNSYTYKIVHQKLLADYNHIPIMPNFLIESTYEGEHNATPVQIRRQAYWAILCGASGQIMGNRPLWLFDPGWQSAMNATASHDMARLKALFNSRAWYDLIPDQDHQVAVGGVGEHNGLDYLAAARTADGSTIIMYMPNSRKVTVNMKNISGPKTQAWWFNPRNGKTISAGKFATRGNRDFMPPDNEDWVLVLDDASRGLPPPAAVAKH
jgi:hypothetical protein